MHHEHSEEKTRIYIAPFHGGGTAAKAACCGRPSQVGKIVTNEDWPYDVGDDPSFFCSKRDAGSLTWGICRPDVRNHIRRGDVVVFFSFKEIKEPKEIQYRFCAVATVADKIGMNQIWGKEAFSRYRRYDNLLIRPTSASHTVWEHFEPKLKGTEAHHDWLWRICEHPKGLRKSTFKGKENLCLSDQIEQHPLKIARNYVIFSTESIETCVLLSPPLVARYFGGQAPETWEKDDLSQGVFRLTLAEANRINASHRFLRVSEASGHPHRHIKWKVMRDEATRWRKRLIEIATSGTE